MINRANMIQLQQFESAHALHEAATRVCLSSLLVEHLAGHAEVIAPFHESVKLFSPLKHALDRLMQHNLGIIQVLLNFCQLVSLSRILQCAKHQSASFTMPLRDQQSHTYAKLS